MNTPYRIYTYLVLAISALVAATGVIDLGEYLIDSLWPGRVIFGESTIAIASGLARIIVAGPIWAIHWRLASRNVNRTPQEADRFFRQAYLHVVLVVSAIAFSVAARQIVIDVLEGHASSLRSESIAGVIIWAGAWFFHWKGVRATWKPGSTGKSLHRWYLYGVSAGSLALLAFGVSSVLAELLRYAYESLFTTEALFISGPWSGELRGGLANGLIGGGLWASHWWVAARGDAGSRLRELYATGGSVIVAASAVSTIILILVTLVRPVLGEIPETLAARWDGLPRLTSDLLVAGLVWVHLSSSSPWSRAGVSPRVALPGARTIDLRLWEVFGLGSLAAGAVIALTLLMSFPVAAEASLLVSSQSRLDGLAAIIATVSIGAALSYGAIRRGRLELPDPRPTVDTVTRFFHYGVAAAGLLSAVGGASAAIFILLRDVLDAQLGSATLLDARWGIAIGLVGGLLTALRWRSIQALQSQAAEPLAENADSKPRIRVIRANERETEVASGAMTRLAGVSKATVGAKGIHLAIATIPPGHRSSPHYHTNCESAIYVASGRGSFLVGEKLEESLPIGPGDFIHVPADAAHQPVNGSDTEDLVLIVARNTPVELVVELHEAPSKPE